MSLSRNGFQFNVCDIEDELEQFIIRKRHSINEDRTDSTNLTIVNLLSKAFYDYVPLLICDVLTLDKTKFINKNVFHVFSIPCKGCILYGRIVGRARDNETYYKYIIDDGTGVIEMSVFKKRNDVETLKKLEDDVNCFELITTGNDKWQTSRCLRRLISKSKHNANFSNISIGSKVLIYCKPSIYKNEVSVNAFSILKNEELIFSLDIVFKNLIVNQHTPV